MKKYNKKEKNYLKEDTVKRREIPSQGKMADLHDKYLKNKDRIYLNIMRRFFNVT